MKINHLRGRRFSVVLSLLGVFAAVAVFGVTASAAGAAANHSARLTAAPASTLVTKISQTNGALSFVAPNSEFVACQGNSPDQPTGVCPLTQPSDDGAAPQPTTFAQASKSLHVSGAAGPTLGANFLGITDLSQHGDTGHHYTPPDQGLCIGAAGPLETAFGFSGPAATDSVLLEMTNDGIAGFDTSGNELFHTSMNTLFQDPYSSGDPECTYDKSSSTYFFTEIGVPNATYYTTGLAVINNNGVGEYNVDTSGGNGYCFPDFPHQSFDTNALYITVNEFCAANQDYAGTGVFAIAKSQLVALTGANAVAFASGVFNFTWRPADGATKTEYFLASDQNAASASDLQVGWVTGDNHIATGSGPVTFSEATIPSEAYSEPVDATSTGDDGGANNTTDCVHQFTASWCSVKEATINSVDDRLEQVQYSGGLLWTSNSTSVTYPNDSTVYDGAAWFAVDPAKLKVVKQGYVASQGLWLLMPSLVQSQYDKKGKGKKNHLIMSFSMTSGTVNPSSGYVTSVNNGNAWSPIETTGVGSGPHVSFSTYDPGYDRRRWGDYSRIAIDPANGTVWSAEEFIPGGADGADTIDNWGTEVWQLSK